MIKFTDGGLATGRTFRTLLKALWYASDGKEVVLVVHNEHYAKVMRHQLIQLADAYSEHVIEKSTYNHINIAGSGASIRIMTTSKAMELDLDPANKENDACVLWDHYARFKYIHGDK